MLLLLLTVAAALLRLRDASWDFSPASRKRRPLAVAVVTVDTMAAVAATPHLFPIADAVHPLLTAVAMQLLRLVAVAEFRLADADATLAVATTTLLVG